MTEMPITRFVKWFLHRNDAPATATTCAACDADVAPGSGTWDPQWRQMLCGSGICEEEAAAARSW